MKCSAGFLIETDEGFLMCHPTGRKDGVRTYDVPKGQVEEGEDHFEAALRELYEETSIDWRNESFNFVLPRRSLTWARAKVVQAERNKK